MGSISQQPKCLPRHIIGRKIAFKYQDLTFSDQSFPKISLFLDRMSFIINEFHNKLHPLHALKDKLYNARSTKWSCFE